MLLLLRCLLFFISFLLRPLNRIFLDGVAENLAQIPLKRRHVLC